MKLTLTIVSLVLFSAPIFAFLLRNKEYAANKKLFLYSFGGPVLGALGLIWAKHL